MSSQPCSFAIGRFDENEVVDSGCQRHNDPQSGAIGSGQSIAIAAENLARVLLEMMSRAPFCLDL